MILITGGACQGKRAFANERFPGLVWADGRECEERISSGVPGSTIFTHISAGPWKQGSRKRSWRNWPGG